MRFFMKMFMFMFTSFKLWTTPTRSPSDGASYMNVILNNLSCQAFIPTISNIQNIRIAMQKSSNCSKFIGTVIIIFRKLPIFLPWISLKRTHALMWSYRNYTFSYIIIQIYNFLPFNRFSISYNMWTPCICSVTIITT